MENVKFLDVENESYAIIEHADGSFTSMPKADYEAQQAEQFTPIVEVE
jgi:hypothetical protein